jgi:hypothetical protein
VPESESLVYPTCGLSVSGDADFRAGSDVGGVAAEDTRGEVSRESLRESLIESDGDIDLLV